MMVTQPSSRVSSFLPFLYVHPARHPATSFFGLLPRHFHHTASCPAISITQPPARNSHHTASCLPFSSHSLLPAIPRKKSGHGPGCARPGRSRRHHQGATAQQQKFSETAHLSLACGPHCHHAVPAAVPSTFTTASCPCQPLSQHRGEHLPPHPAHVDPRRLRPVRQQLQPGGGQVQQRQQPPLGGWHPDLPPQAVSGAQIGPLLANVVAGNLKPGTNRAGDK